MSSFIAPQATTVAAFRVAGIAVRTTNAAEADPASARIGPLWDRFFSESWEHKLPPPGADGRVFGVYSGYASDQHGAFDVTAGGLRPAWRLRRDRRCSGAGKPSGFAGRHHGGH